MQEKNKKRKTQELVNLFVITAVILIVAFALGYKTGYTNGEPSGYIGGWNNAKLIYSNTTPCTNPNLYSSKCSSELIKPNAYSNASNSANITCIITFNSLTKWTLPHDCYSGKYYVANTT